MQEQPDDVTLRLIFADFLEERGDPRGELLRLTVTLTQSIDIPNRAEQEGRLRALLQEDVQPIGPYWTNSLGMKFAWILPGTFLMGSPKEEEGRGGDEIQHKVTLTKGFFMSVHLGTQKQWQTVMGSNPSEFKGDKNLPVEQVSWNDCQEFIKKLQGRDQKPYRLPSEAEWEYACRAGTTTPYYFGETISTDQANYDGNYTYGKGKKGEYREKTTPVGTFPANAWGLHDTHGNLWEWCQNWYGDYLKNEVVDPQEGESEDYRVLRGGSWFFDPERCRSARRRYVRPGVREGIVGFRLCFSLDEESVPNR